MSKFISRAGSQIDEFQRQLASNDSEHSSLLPSRSSSTNKNNIPRQPSKLNQSFLPQDLHDSNQTTSNLHFGALDPRLTLARRQSFTSPQKNNSPQGNSGKLGTFEGVFLQVVLNIWGVILYLRLGYIIGQVGLIVTLLMFTFGYCITTFTTLSLSAISTNGTVRGGGPYYMISRSLGPEFGGSIGIIVYLGTSLNVVLNSLAAVEGLKEFFGAESGTLYQILPDSKLWNFAYGTSILLLALLICFTGSKSAARVSLGFACLLLLSTLSIAATFMFQTPFDIPSKGIYYTSISLDTLRGNLWPQLSTGENGVTETFQSIFGVLFPACIGIMAGASMSGDLKNPSKSIPKGTLCAIGTTFVAYFSLTTMFAATTARVTLKNDLNVMTHIGLYPPLVNIGVLSTSISSAIGCYMAASKILQAMARDNLMPFLRVFSYGTSKGDEPIMGLVLTYMLCQLFILAGEINLVAGVVTMFFVLTFGVTNLACFLLKAGAAPNFRPSFKYFKGWTAGVGVVICFGAMYYVDPIKALLSTVFACVLFGLIHFFSPPKSWGDVTQSLIYHQVRKYLLRLDSRKDHVKFWRPQILLLVNDPRSSFQLIKFCNSLKKGSLYILGHVLKGDMRAQLSELKRQKVSWLKFVDVVNIKAFTQLSVASDERLGARNLLLGSGLGGMAPNILVMGAFNMRHHRQRSMIRRDISGDDGPLESIGSPPLGSLLGPLPTDEMKSELPISVSNYVGIIEDGLLLGKAVAIAFDFSRTPLPACLPSALQPDSLPSSKYIDLWPIQMASSTRNDNSFGVTNFDSYTMVLQLGCILHMVPQWKERYQLRVCCFVEHSADILEEQLRVQLLLDNLRIPALLNVFSLDDGSVDEYEKVFGINSRTSNRIIPGDIPLVSEPTMLSTSLRINVPIPDHQGMYPDSSVASDNEDSDDQLSDDLLADLDQLSTTNHQRSLSLSPQNFNELPASTQNLILNNLMRLQSKDTALVFSTLPAPESNCGDADDKALKYLESLESLVDHLPPCVLVHSKSLTVTTSL